MARPANRVGASVTVGRDAGLLPLQPVPNPPVHVNIAQVFSQIGLPIPSLGFMLRVERVVDAEALAMAGG